MKQIIADKNLVAYCGLYCGACRSYLKGRCPGCHENTKASWCKIRPCCAEHSYATCADCEEFTDPDDCRKFNNWIGKSPWSGNPTRNMTVDEVRLYGVALTPDPRLRADMRLG